MAEPTYPGIVDYSDNPILPPWFIPGWTSQNEGTTNLPAPLQSTVRSQLPTWLTYVMVTFASDDGNGASLGGYFEFEQSHDLLVTDDTVTPTAFFRVPKRLVGEPPTLSMGNTLAYNQYGSGKLYLQFGYLQVMLLANDNPDITIFSNDDNTNPPVSWNYHVREFFKGGKKYDIVVPSAATSPVDIHQLMVPGTVKNNYDWDRGY